MKMVLLCPTKQDLGLPEGAPAQRICQPPIPKVSVLVFRKPAQALRSPHHHYHNRNNGPRWLRDLSAQELTEKHSVLVRASQLSSANGKGHLISQVGNANTLDNTQPKRPNSPRHELRLSSLSLLSCQQLSLPTTLGAASPPPCKAVTSFLNHYICRAELRFQAQRKTLHATDGIACQPLETLGSWKKIKGKNTSKLTL